MKEKDKEEGIIATWIILTGILAAGAGFTISSFFDGQRSLGLGLMTSGGIATLSMVKFWALGRFEK